MHKSPFILAFPLRNFGFLRFIPSQCWGYPCGCGSTSTQWVRVLRPIRSHDGHRTFIEEWQQLDELAGCDNARSVGRSADDIEDEQLPKEER